MISDQSLLLSTIVLNDVCAYHCHAHLPHAVEQVQICRDFRHLHNQGNIRVKLFPLVRNFVKYLLQIPLIPTSAQPGIGGNDYAVTNVFQSDKLHIIL